MPLQVVDGIDDELNGRDDSGSEGDKTIGSASISGSAEGGELADSQAVKFVL